MDALFYSFLMPLNAWKSLCNLVSFNCLKGSRRWIRLRTVSHGVPSSRVISVSLSCKGTAPMIASRAWAKSADAEGLRYFFKPLHFSVEQHQISPAKCPNSRFSDHQTLENIVKHFCILKRRLEFGFLNFRPALGFW